MNRLGAGPASISAGIYAVSCRKRALILEKGQVGGAENISLRLASRLHAVYGQDQVERLEIAISGVYAAGDIRVKQIRQVATAVSDGAIAAINAAL